MPMDIHKPIDRLGKIDNDKYMIMLQQVCNRMKHNVIRALKKNNKPIKV